MFCGSPFVTINNVNVTEHSHSLTQKKVFQFFLFIHYWKDDFAALKAIKTCQGTRGYVPQARCCTIMHRFTISGKELPLMCVILKRYVSMEAVPPSVT